MTLQIILEYPDDMHIRAIEFTEKSFLEERESAATTTPGATSQPLQLRLSGPSFRGRVRRTAGHHATMNSAIDKTGNHSGFSGNTVIWEKYTATAAKTLARRIGEILQAQRGEIEAIATRMPSKVGGTLGWV